MDKLAELINNIDLDLLKCVTKQIGKSNLTATRLVFIFDKYYTTNWSTVVANKIAETRVVHGTER